MWQVLAVLRLYSCYTSQDVRQLEINQVGPYIACSFRRQASRILPRCGGCGFLSSCPTSQDVGQLEMFLARASIWLWLSAANEL